jgi:transcriptional regulator with XRE-family HTH domain
MDEIADNVALFATPRLVHQRIIRIEMEEGELGRRLRAFRATRGLSLAKLAQRTGISSSFLSLVEQGKSDITITRLLRLAQFYEVGLGDLISEDGIPGREPIVVHRSSAATIHSAGEGIDIYFLLTGHNHPFSATISVYGPSATLTVEPGFDRETFAYVLSGKFRIASAGASALTVRTGDAVSYHLGRSYSWTNLSRREGSLLHVTAQLVWRGPTDQLR